MKEYQATRKKLEARRLAYDTSLAKMQKTKKEDFRMEEELRAQKAKYEETSEDVFRRMQDIKESEVDMVQDLNSFLEAELSYHDRCREILLNVKREWPLRYESEGTIYERQMLTYVIEMRSHWPPVPSDRDLLLPTDTRTASILLKKSPSRNPNASPSLSWAPAAVRQEEIHNPKVVMLFVHPLVVLPRTTMVRTGTATTPQLDV